MNMPKTTIAVWLLFLIMVSTWASEEDIFNTHYKITTIVANGWDGLGDVKASYSYSLIAKSPKLEDVFIEYKNKKINVPAKNLLAHPNILIDSARISGEAGYDKYPWIYLSFQLKDNAKKRFYFGFQGGKFIETFTHGT
jgi:hypothetical protein